MLKKTLSNQLPSNQFPKITFGMIVLNGEPFTRYCIRALYPHAHQILVVEGAVEKARSIATPEGHSTDSTRETLASVKAHEDPENKITVISRDGFWADKVVMSHAYTELATGDYLWQVDSDEFYLDEDIEKIRNWLAQDPTIDGATFRWRLFWGNEKYLTDGWFLRSDAGDVNRLFRWEKGFYYDHYGKHPNGPTVTTPEGFRLNDGNWLSASKLAKAGIYQYHFSLVFPDQVLKKAKGYTAGVSPGTDNSQMYDWAQRNWLSLENPFRVHNRYQYISWLQRYEGPLPQAAVEMFEDIRSGKVKCSMRDMEDVIQIEGSPFYRIKRIVLRYAGDFVNRWQGTKVAFWVIQICYKWVDVGLMDVFKSTLKKMTFVSRN
jgi:hypothetical protein